MNFKFYCLGALFLALTYTIPAIAQSSFTELSKQATNYHSSSVRMAAGDFEAQSHCLSPSERSFIIEDLKLARQKYGGKNLSLEKSNETSFVLPYRLSPEANYFHGFTVSNYVDHDASNGIQDFNCSDNSYDGHNGTDFSPFPFPWYLYESNLVEVVAAADGVIIDKQDGNFDANCELVGNWNAVFLEHSDGSIGWYGHMKTNSLTGKAVGESVVQGEYLGVIASSGKSTNAHLHFEVYDSNFDLVDPFQGNCNNLNSNSLWCDQLPHENSKLNAILTHSSDPQFGCGPDVESAFISNEFEVNDSMFLGVYYTEMVAGKNVNFQILDPENAVYDEFDFNFNGNSFEFYWLVVGYKLAEEDMPGTWSAEVEFDGEIFVHEFDFNIQASGVDDIEENQLRLFPIPSKNRLTVEGLEIQNAMMYEIVNSAGQILKQGELNSPQIEIVDLPDGLYFLKINQVDKNWTLPFVKAQ